VSHPHCRILPIATAMNGQAVHTDCVFGLPRSPKRELSEMNEHLVLVMVQHMLVRSPGATRGCAPQQEQPILRQQYKLTVVMS